MSLNMSEFGLGAANALAPCPPVANSLSDRRTLPNAGSVEEPIPKSHSWVPGPFKLGEE